MRNWLVCFLLLAAFGLNAVAAVMSPNGRLAVEERDGGLAVAYKGHCVLQVPSLGFEGSQALANLKFVREVASDYEMLSGKRRHCVNKAREYEALLGPDVGVEGKCKMVLRVYNDGIAFRYESIEGALPPKELTSYRIAEGTNRWMQQWTEAYEGFFPPSATARVKPIPSFSGISKSAAGYNCHWGYPALVEVANAETTDGAACWLLITEAGVSRGQSASSLWNDEREELFRVVPAENEGKAVCSPWRVVVIGALADVVESTLVTDVSQECQVSDTAWIKPGVVSWVYWAYNHGSNDYNIIKKYVDMAARLRLPYVLIDAEWDEMKDGKTVEDAIRYARSRGVNPMIWYNSSVGWVDGAPGPKFRLNKAADREREFAWCERSGVAGVKIDFFSGDTQRNMDYCIDLLECAARHHLLVNFHGATIPRGWQRTYPNLLSTEAVYGAEWYNNVGTFTDKAARHNATLPFTRNVVGPMDYTPCAFSDSQHPHITTNAHELALTVLFESGLQHLADRPESYYAQPAAVQRFFASLPAAWDDTRLVGGYPGEWIVMARRSGNTWYVAGINGSDAQRTVALNWDFLEGHSSTSTQFADALDGLQPPPNTQWDIQERRSLPSAVDCLPRGGFVFVVKSK